MFRTAVSISAIVACLLPQRIGLYVAGSAAPPDPSLLQLSDLTCAGMFLSPHIPSDASAHTSNYPITFRYDSGHRQYFTYDGAGNVHSFLEPALVSCGSSFGSMNSATIEQDWGAYTVHAALGGAPPVEQIPGQGNSVEAAGLNFDGAGRLLLSWYPAYGLNEENNSFAAATLDEGAHTLTTVGCWGLEGYNTTQVGSGVLEIPSSFVTNYLPTGQHWAVGFGGIVGYATGNSNGPSLSAIAPPSTNPCASLTSYITGSGDISLMEIHPSNSNGPNCSYPADLGCTPADPPTNPLSAQSSYANYSVSVYPINWDPYTGHGWFTYLSESMSGWYQDSGGKAGVLAAFLMPSGWNVGGTVAASPAPTFDTGTQNGTFTWVGSLDVHDGTLPSIGDLVWVQSCVPGGGDPFCESANANYLTLAIITAINTSTKAVSYHARITDSGVGDHVPIVPGQIVFGCIYARAEPQCSRQTLRLQIYDPAQLAEVLASTRTHDAVVYHEEQSLSDILTSYGGILPGNTAVRPSGIMADPSHHQIVFAMSDAVTGTGFVQDLIAVYDVAHAAPTPQPVASWPMLALLIAVVALGPIGRKRYGV